MISTTFQLGTNGSYVEKFLVGSGDSDEEEDFLKSVVLAIETLGDINIDYDYEMENETSEPAPSSSSNPSSPNPSSVQLPPNNVIIPAPSTRQPVVQNPAPEPMMNQEPEPVPVSVVNQVPEPVMNQVPEPIVVIVPVAPTTQEPAPTTQNPAPSAQNPGPSFINVNSGTKRAGITVVVPPNTVSVAPEQAPSPSINNSTLNATTNFTTQWVHVFFTPKTFNVTILSNITDIYYIRNGPCMSLIDYWDDVTMGCPCGGTWDNIGYYNSSSQSFEGGRQITPSLCPNNTCQESLFLNDTTVYANLRLNTTTWSNGTIANKTVEITKVSPFKDIGYAYDEQDIIAVFLWSNGTDNASLPSIPVEVTKPDMNETTSYSGSVSLPLTSVVTMMFAFLLIMYENTQ